MGCHSRAQRWRRGKDAWLSAPWGPSQKQVELAAALAARDSGAARKMPASCEGLINLLPQLPGNDLEGSRCVYFLSQLSGK